MKNNKICLLSCLHNLKDDRIYWKEALSLKKAGYSLTHIGVSNKEYTYVSNEGIKLISLKQKSYLKNPYLNFLFKRITLKKSIYQKLFEAAEKEKADIYHFHDYQINKITRKLKRLTNNPKLIYDVHEPYSVTIKSLKENNIFWKYVLNIFSRRINNLELKNIKHLDCIIATEENVCTRFKDADKKIRVETIYNYTDLEMPKSINKVYDFIYCGAIRKRRGIYEIINSINILKEKIPDVKLLFLGDFQENGLKIDVENYINTNKLNENIILKDFVPYKEVINYYSQSKIGLAIFKNIQVNHIIMPIKIFEYIALGLPVITSNFGHMKQITEEYNTGITIDPENINELVEAMYNLLKNNILYNKLKDNCIESSSKFKWKLMEDKLLSIYSKIISQ